MLLMLSRNYNNAIFLEFKANKDFVKYLVGILFTYINYKTYSTAHKHKAELSKLTGRAFAPGYIVMFMQTRGPPIKEFRA